MGSSCLWLKRFHLLFCRSSTTLRFAETKAVFLRKYTIQVEHKDETPDSSDTNFSEKNDDDVSEIKLQILKSALNFVSEHGWSQQSLALGAESNNLSSASHSLITDGPVDLVHYFNFSCNEKLETYLSEKYSLESERKDLTSFLVDALGTRLKMVVPYISSWPQAMAMMLPPPQFATHSKNMLDLVNIICSYSGDKKLDLTWYSKRVTLGMTYKMSELSLVQDKSPEFSHTFDFLERQVDNVVRRHEFINKFSENLPAVGMGVCVTIRNFLGANRWFR